MKADARSAPVPLSLAAAEGGAELGKEGEVVFEESEEFCEDATEEEPGLVTAVADAV